MPQLNKALSGTFHVIFPILLLMLGGCNSEAPKEPDKKTLPSRRYHYVDQLPEDIQIANTVYVPVYSDIYYSAGDRRFPLTATLSIRNTSLTDTIYLTGVDYYDSQGQLLTQYLNRPVQMHPLESLEFIVEGGTEAGGAGANFIVDWEAGNPNVSPIIQCVMIGASGTQGISFLTEGFTLESRHKSRAEQ